MEEAPELRHNRCNGLIHRSGAMRLYVFACPTGPRGKRNLLVAAHSIDYGDGGERGELVKIVRNCNEYRG